MGPISPYGVRQIKQSMAASSAMKTGPFPLFAPAYAAYKAGSRADDSQPSAHTMREINAQQVTKQAALQQK